MGHISKPFYRIIRPLFTKEYENYFLDMNYAPSMNDQIRTAFYLEEQIINLFKYVEPAEENAKVYSNIMWQLLVQICTEVESNFKLILSSNNYKKAHLRNSISLQKPLSKVSCNIKDDYYLLNTPLRLFQYSVKIPWRESNVITEKILEPFKEWSNDTYDSLLWYRSYNNIKHNRFENFCDANYINVLKAFAALRVILFTQFSSYSCARSKKINVFSSDYGEELICDGNPSIGVRELYNDADYYNESIFQVVPLEKSFWIEDEKYEFDWSILSTNQESKFDKYPF